VWLAQSLYIEDLGFKSKLVMLKAQLFYMLPSRCGPLSIRNDGVIKAACLIPFLDIDQKEMKSLPYRDTSYLSI
jgi:hypothetical protein